MASSFLLMRQKGVYMFPVLDILVRRVEIYIQKTSFIPFLVLAYYVLTFSSRSEQYRELIRRDLIRSSLCVSKLKIASRSCSSDRR